MQLSIRRGMLVLKEISLKHIFIKVILIQLLEQEELTLVFRKLAMLTVIVMLMSLVFGALAPVVDASEGDLNIFPPTILTQNVEMDESVVYRWGIYNNGSTPHTVLVDVSEGEFGWSAEISDENAYFVLDPGAFESVEVTITAPNSRDYPDYSYTISSTLRDLVTEESWTEGMGTVTTIIIGGAYIPPTQVMGLFDNPLAQLTPSLDNEYGVFLTTILIWMLVGLIIFFVLDPLVKQFTKKTETTLDDQILAIIKGPVFGLIVAYGVVSSLKVLNLSWSVIHSLEVLYSFLLIILVAWMAFKILKDVLLIWGKAYAEKSETTLDDVMLPLFEKLGMILIAIIAMIMMLNLMGIDVTMLLAGMGIIGLVIAFAAQDTLGNFISGMFLLTDRPFKVGDLVLMQNGDYCRVEKIGMRSTKLYNTFDHDVIILPNSKIANEMVVNLTEPDNKMKVKVTVGVSYDTDIKKAKSIMLDVANTHPDVLQDDDRKPFARLVEFADSAINIKLYTWVNHLDNQWRVGGEIREEIWTRFQEEGIEIPFPQRVIHMENGQNDTRTPTSEGLTPKRMD